MTNPQLQRMTMNLTVDKFFDEASTIIKDSIPNLNQACADLKLLNLKIVSHLEVQQRILTGFKVNKAKARQDLTATTLEVSSMLKAHAEHIKNYELYYNSKCTKRLLAHSREHIFLDICKNIFNSATTHQESAQGFGLTPDTLKEFQINLASYKLALPSVRSQQIKKNRATSSLKEDLQKSLELLKTIDGLIQIKVNREPDFHKEYFIARKLPKLSFKTLSARGSVKSTTGEPIRCNIICPELNINRKTSSNGTFIFPNLPDGNYEIMFQIRGYKTETARLKVSAGNRAELNVILEKLQPINP